MNKKKLFISNINFSVTPKELREAAEIYGEVVNCNILMDRETRKSRGMGFVEFNTEKDAEAALTGLKGKSIKGREIRVDYAKERN